jgi:hypothetical protein
MLQHFAHSVYEMSTDTWCVSMSPARIFVETTPLALSLLLCTVKISFSNHLCIVVFGTPLTACS